MTSQNPVIALRLDQATFDKIRQLAERDGRSMSNFVEHQLKRLLHPNLDPALPASYYEAPAKGRQIHLEDAIAAVVKRGPVNSVSNNTSAMTHGDLKRAQHKKNMAARAARMAERAAKHK
jgi:hypothetical protein